PTEQPCSGFRVSPDTEQLDHLRPSTPNASRWSIRPGRYGFMTESSHFGAVAQGPARPFQSKAKGRTRYFGDFATGISKYVRSNGAMSSPSQTTFCLVTLP